MKNEFYDYIKKYLAFEHDGNDKIFCRSDNEKCGYLKCQQGNDDFKCSLFKENLFRRNSGTAYEVRRCDNCLKYFKEI